MATKGRTVPERIARWKVLAAGLKPLLPQLPHLKELHDQLEQVISEAEDLDARSEALKAESQEATRRRDELGKAGEDLRGRLGAAVRTLHGFKSEKLLEFGLTPRKPRGPDRKPRAKRRPQTGQTPAQPGQPTTPIHTTQ